MYLVSNKDSENCPPSAESSSTIIAGQNNDPSIRIPAGGATNGRRFKESLAILLEEG